MKKGIILYGGVGVFFLILILYMTGVFSPKIYPGKEEVQPFRPSQLKGIEEVRAQKVIPHHLAIGTISSDRKMAISSQIRGVVEAIEVKEGQRIEKGQLLVEIDDSEFQTRLEQARQGVDIARAARQQAVQTLVTAQANLSRVQYELQSAEDAVGQAREQLNSAQAGYKEAESSYERTKKLKQDKAVTKAEFEQAQARYSRSKARLEQARLGVEMAKKRLSGVKAMVTSAQAAVKQAQLGIESAKARQIQARESVKQARIALSYTRIKAPDSGVVVDKRIEVGDLAWPGKPLVILHKPKVLKLEAEVSESLRKGIQSNSEYWVEVTSIGYKKKGKVAEIVPSADPRTRTFRVKLVIPYEKDLYPGMFGTLLIPLPAKKLILLPPSAIQRVGQFESIYVQKGKDNWIRRFITTGKKYDSKIEVLSGLASGEKVARLKEVNHE